MNSIVIDTAFVVATMLVAIGIYGLLNSKNVIRVLLSSEIILNASILLLFSLSSLAGKSYTPLIFFRFSLLVWL